MTCSRCERYVPSGSVNIELVRRYMRPKETALCVKCLNKDSNYIRDYGRLPGRG